MSPSHIKHVYSILGGTALSTLAALPSGASELSLKLQLPEIQTTQYLRPYVAVWIETADSNFVSTLSLWHMVKSKRGDAQVNGDRYLNTLREWWRQSGTSSQMPVDGLSSATRAPGEHELVFQQGSPPLNTLPPGKYQLVLEAAREVKGPRPGGTAPRASRPDNADNMATTAGQPPARERGMRGPGKDSHEVVRVNFEWPVKKTTTVTAQGNTEFGNISLLLKP